jgi:hypothetical protein
MEKNDASFIRFTGQNDSAWSFQFEIFVKGKGLWDHIVDPEEVLVAPVGCCC